MFNALRMIAVWLSGTTPNKGLQADGRARIEEGGLAAADLASSSERF